MITRLKSTVLRLMGLLAFLFTSEWSLLAQSDTAMLKRLSIDIDIIFSQMDIERKNLKTISSIDKSLTQISYDDIIRTLDFNIGGLANENRVLQDSLKSILARVQLSEFLNNVSQNRTYLLNQEKDSLQKRTQKILDSTATVIKYLQNQSAKLSDSLNRLSSLYSEAMRQRETLEELNKIIKDSLAQMVLRQDTVSQSAQKSKDLSGLQIENANLKKINSLYLKTITILALLLIFILSKSLFQKFIKKLFIRNDPYLIATDSYACSIMHIRDDYVIADILGKDNLLDMMEFETQPLKGIVPLEPGQVFTVKVSTYRGKKVFNYAAGSDVERETFDELYKNLENE